MKYLLILLFLPALCFSVTLDEEDVPSYIIDNFSQNLKQLKKVYISVDSNYQKKEIETSIEEFCLFNSITVYDSLTEDSQKVVVSLSKSDVLVKSRSFFGRPLKKYHIALKVIENNQISVSKTITFNMDMSDNEYRAIKWYDPLLVTAVFSGLIYFFYYGS